MGRYVTVLDNLAGSPHGEDMVKSEQRLGKCRGVGKADTGGRVGKVVQEEETARAQAQSQGVRRA